MRSPERRVRNTRKGIRSPVRRRGMAEERVVEFSCPVKIKLTVPKDCTLSEKALKERLEKVGPQLFIGLCDGCPWYEGRDKG